MTQWHESGGIRPPHNYPDRQYQGRGGRIST
jgi:hypothetical protein